MKRFLILWAVLGCLCATPAHADVDAVFSASTENGGTLRTFTGDDLQTQYLEEINLPGVTALAVGDLVTTSPGPELVLGREGRVELRAGFSLELLTFHGGFDLVNSLAIGDAVTTSAGSEIIVGSTTGGLGRVTVLQAHDPLLPELGFMSIGQEVTGVAVGDVRSAVAGNEIVYGWTYQTVPTTETQVLVTNFSAINSLFAFVNVTGDIKSILLDNATSTTSAKNIYLGMSDGAVRVIDGTTAASPLATLTLRAGFGAATSLAMGEIRADQAGRELIVGADYGGGSLWMLMASDLNNIDFRTGFGHVDGVALGNLYGPRLGNEIVVGHTLNDIGVVRVLDPDAGLADLGLRAGFGPLSALGVYSLVPPPVVSRAGAWELLD